MLAKIKDETMSKYSLIFVTVPDKRHAKKIARALLKERLAACVNIINSLESFFWWQGKIDRASESLLIIKTKKQLFSKISKLVTKLHPYDTPEVISLSLEKIIPRYRRWLDASISKSS